MKILFTCLAGAAAVAAGPVAAYEPLVEKQSFTIPEFTTQSGEVVPDMTIGWEAYGELNEARDNVILIPHFFSGNPTPPAATRRTMPRQATGTPSSARGRRSIPTSTTSSRLIRR